MKQTNAVDPKLCKRIHPVNRTIETILAATGIITIGVTIAIVFILGEESIIFFKHVSLRQFFTTFEWQPHIEKFGIWPLLNATITTSLFGMLVALPIGFFTAVFLAEYASNTIKRKIKPVLEILAGIPTVVFGYFALNFITPFLQLVFGKAVSVYNTASAGIAIGILLVPLVASLIEEALSAVPRHLREAAYAVGATKLEVTLGIVVPSALSGIIATILLALSRAFGETMIVAIAAGAGPAFTLNPFKSAETMTGHMARIAGGDLPYDSIDYQSLFAIALFLFFITFFLNLLGRSISKRYMEHYE
ncbi:MAG TPA: phosphate ABC transporter permease subunit PstC [Spirochaetales bacterium]|nr:phosphate ABC transporter permease subunit PstC [Spirochaetales bacterium]HQK35085.1 phosphate ABC transporter permease subunit PstC [Spirochaetales bacterium]